MGRPCRSHNGRVQRAPHKQTAISMKGFHESVHCTAFSNFASITHQAMLQARYQAAQLPLLTSQQAERGFTPCPACLMIGRPEAALWQGMQRAVLPLRQHSGGGKITIPDEHHWVYMGRAHSGRPLILFSFCAASRLSGECVWRTSLKG